MMLESITRTTTAASTNTSAAADAMKQSLGMNKDDFLKLFVTQLQNQDPLNPMEGTEYVSQLAQMTQLEQAYNTNTNLQNIINALNSSSYLSSASLIGQTITATDPHVILTEGGQPQINYTVPKDATQLTIEIKDANGNVVRTMTQGQTAAGDGSIAWDGKDDSGTQLAAGVYTVSVTGTDASGSSITCATKFTGRVDGIDFSGGIPMLVSGGVKISFGSLLGVSGG